MANPKRKVTINAYIDPYYADYIYGENLTKEDIKKFSQIAIKGKADLNGKVSFQKPPPEYIYLFLKNTESFLQGYTAINNVKIHNYDELTNEDYEISLTDSTVSIPDHELYGYVVWDSISKINENDMKKALYKYQDPLKNYIEDNILPHLPDAKEEILNEILANEIYEETKDMILPEIEEDIDLFYNKVLKPTLNECKTEQSDLLGYYECMEKTYKDKIKENDKDLFFFDYNYGVVDSIRANIRFLIKYGHDGKIKEKICTILSNHMDEASKFTDIYHRQYLDKYNELCGGEQSE